MTEKHLLFAVLAFESELLDLAQLTAACRAWAADKSKPLADLLVERGWITAAARGFVEMQLERKLAKHQHDPRVTLNAVTRGDVCDAIKEIDDPDIQQSLSSWPSSGPILIDVIDETLVNSPGVATEVAIHLGQLHFSEASVQYAPFSHNLLSSTLLFLVDIR